MRGGQRDEVDRALAQAEGSARRWADGTARPLEGVPFGLKDNLATAGIPTTGASRAYADYVPSVDATVRLVPIGLEISCATPATRPPSAASLSVSMR